MGVQKNEKIMNFFNKKRRGQSPQDASKPSKSELHDLVGKYAMVGDHPLKPYGYIIYQGRYIEAVALYRFLPEYTAVRIARVELNIVFVEEDLRPQRRPIWSKRQSEITRQVKEEHISSSTAEDLSTKHQSDSSAPH